MVEIYRKIKLVPFGEYVPLRRYLTFINVINMIGDISAGKDITVFPYKGKKFSVLICFEDIFPLHVMRYSRGKDFLVNITNDAWFRGEPQASQHLAIMTFRAIENRISIIRSANTGISGWVSFEGDIHSFKTEGKKISISGSGTFIVSLNRLRSFYNRYGEFFPALCFVFIMGIWLVIKLRKYKLAQEWESD